MYDPLAFLYAKDAIDDIQARFKRGEVEGIVFGLKLSDGSFVGGWAGDISFLERIGIIASMAWDQQAVAAGLIKPTKTIGEEGEEGEPK
jgi:hypothetical protein